MGESVARQRQDNNNNDANMGNTPPSSSSRRRKSSSANAAERAKKVVGEIGEELKKSVKKLDEDHPAAQLIDQVCGGYFDEEKYRQSNSASFYSEGEESVGDGSRTVSEDDATYESRSKKDATSVEEESYVSLSTYDDSEPKRRSGSGRKVGSRSFDTEDADSKITAEESQQNGPLLSKPLASSFAKRCYFTKAGIGKTTQHYEGLTLTGNIVLMLAAAMKLKGCPTICDEDLRRVEQTYPNQFSRLPDELLLSSGWRRISKYCHFSNKPIPDGVPFFRKNSCFEKRCSSLAQPESHSLTLCLLACRFETTTPSYWRILLFAGWRRGYDTTNRCGTVDSGHASVA